jgi:chromosome segregation ATPase
MRIRCRPTLFALVFSCACINSTWASGDKFPGSGLKPGEAPEGRVLTLNELDACLEVERTLRRLDSEIDQAELIQSLSDTRQRGLDSIISAERQTLDRSDAGDVSEFNARIDELGREIDEYNARVEPNNERIRAHTAAVERFNAECTFRYYEADMLKALSQRERRLAAEIEAETKAAEKSP